jgi:hypothetical protein
MNPVHLLAACALGLVATTARAACSGAGLTWSCPAGATSDDAQAALDAASDGATITFEAGTYDLANWVLFSNDKGATLRCATEPPAIGAAASGCIVTYDGSAAFGSHELSGVNTHRYRISGFVFDGRGSGTAIWFEQISGSYLVMAGPDGLGGVRLDHDTFQNITTGTVVLFGDIHGTANYDGLIDHDVFELGPTANAIVYQGDTILPPDVPPSPQGTAANLFIEDNTFHAMSVSGTPADCLDPNGGASVVVRHNQSTNCMWYFEGVLHGGGTFNVEVYDNEIGHDQGAMGSGFEDGYRLVHHEGSSEYLAFNNLFRAFSGKSAEALSLLHYRDYANLLQGAPFCDGTSTTPPWLDGNRSPPTTYRGYPCWRQPGRDAATLALMPVYSWNNAWADTLAEVALAAPDYGDGVSLDYHAQHLQADRDFYNAVSALAQASPTSPFDGTTGMGFGSLANRPATCTTNALESGGGVGYFAVDVGPQGTLFRCSAANVWSVQYAPYPYPHPLVGGEQTAGLEHWEWVGCSCGTAHIGPWGLGLIALGFRRKTRGRPPRDRTVDTCYAGLGATGAAHRPVARSS